MEVIFPHDYIIISLRLQLYVTAHIILFHFSKSTQCFITLYAQKVILIGYLIEDILP